MVRARLYKGPMNGKVVNHNGQNELIIDFIKKPRRGTKAWREQTVFDSQLYNPTAHILFDRRRAIYRQVRVPGPSGPIPSVHPDGSVFYIYVDR